MGERELSGGVWCLSLHAAEEDGPNLFSILSTPGWLEKSSVLLYYIL